MNSRGPGRAVSLALVLGVIAMALAAASACGGDSAGRSEPRSAVADQILALDIDYANAWLRGDWTAVASIVAPDYCGVGDGFSWDLATLKQEFPKIRAMEYRPGPPASRQLTPDIVLLCRANEMRETYDGADISGRYWISETWVRRDGRWKLLVEQEVAMPPTNPKAP